jgi:hypothetical protein
MKKLSIFIIMIVLSIFLSTIAIADPLNLQVTLESQSPDPVEPGEVVTIKIKLENLGEETRDNAIVKFKESAQFTIYNDNLEKNVGRLRGGATGADSVIVEFDIKVDEAAVEGDQTFDFTVQVGTSITTYSQVIEIETRDAILDITSISIEPEQIPPGQNGIVQIFTKNLADSLLRDIKFTLDLSDVPLAPYQSSSQRSISQLQTNHQLPLSFNLIADPSATPGLYKIPLNISYTDESGRSYLISELLAVPVGEFPQIQTYIKKSTVLQAKSSGVITIELANAGTSDVKFMEMIIEESSDYEIISTSNYFYIGDIDSDDTESEEINIFVNKGVDVLSLPITLQYYDANNNIYDETRVLELDLYSKSELKRFGLISSSNSSTIVILLLIVGGVFFWYRKRKGKKMPSFLSFGTKKKR